jgi:hypothetical protein
MEQIAYLGYIMDLLMMTFTLCCMELKVKMIHGFSFARCDSKGLLDFLCTRILATRDGNITVSLDVEAATINRDILSQNHLLPLV